MTAPANCSDENAPIEIRTVEISREPVELYKILKFEGMVTSGGEAKVVVAAGRVMVNGVIEIQKRKKIVSGDTIEFNNEKLIIKFVPAVAVEIPPAEADVDFAATAPVVEAVVDSSDAIVVEEK